MPRLSQVLDFLTKTLGIVLLFISSFILCALGYIHTSIVPTMLLHHNHPILAIIDCFVGCQIFIAGGFVAVQSDDLPINY